MRVLLLCHGHPAFSIGGAEVASYNLFNGINRLADCEAHYLARVGPPIGRHRDTPLLSLRRGRRETLFFINDYDHFRLSNRASNDLALHLGGFIRDLAPDVVHFHHVLGFGVETLHLVRKMLPHAAIVLTLHEYLSICHNNGQMVRTTNGGLCSRSSPAECAVCFPQHTAADFMRRELYLKAAFDCVDVFVSPSRFLMERYADWGLDCSRIVVLENGIEASDIAPPRKVASEGARRNRFGFFGQINPFKGVTLLLEAIARVPAAVWGEDSVLNLYGGNLDVQPKAFQDEFRQLLTAAGDRVRFFGSYKSAELPALMGEVDWVVVPSTWWENAPVVIQEAFLHGRPVICSNIGGMAEKVRDGIDGLHFRAASVESLVDRLVTAISSPNLWNDLRAHIPPPNAADAMAARHVQLYQQRLNGRQGARGGPAGATATDLAGFAVAAE
jgi:glycosyltransferase involved in cell wall biosynthesis